MGFTLPNVGYGYGWRTFCGIWIRLVDIYVPKPPSETLPGAKLLRSDSGRHLGALGTSFVVQIRTFVVQIRTFVVQIRTFVVQNRTFVVQIRTFVDQNRRKGDDDIQICLLYTSDAADE